MPQLIHPIIAARIADGTYDVTIPLKSPSFHVDARIGPRHGWILQGDPSSESRLRVQDQYGS